MEAISDFEIVVPIQGQVMNPSILVYKGQTILCYRLGQRGKLVLCILKEDMKTCQDESSHILDLGHLPEDRDSQEDPRLFIYKRETPYCLHGGVVGRSTRNWPTPSVCLARLGEDLKVEASWAPHLEDRHAWEKNWTPFELDDRLLAVYQISPHVILDLTEPEASILYTSAVPFPGVDGYLRGGACPVLHDGVYWCFYHVKRSDQSYLGRLYTFSALPPYQPLDHVPEPLLSPHLAHKPSAYLQNVVFPGGAILREDKWYIAYGAWDRQVRMAVYEHQDLVEALKPLPPLKAMTTVPFDHKRFQSLGPWGTRWEMGGETIGGGFDPSMDFRVQEFFRCYPCPKRVLETSCWEGGHTVLLAKGAVEVVTVEGREVNITKAQFMLDSYGIGNVTLIPLDVEKETLGGLGNFDVVFCVGLLYHLKEPWSFLEKLSHQTENLFLWTHLAHVNEGTEEPLPGITGKWMEENMEDTLGGMWGQGFWPTENGLYQMLLRAGFNTITFLHSGRDHEGREHTTLIAKRT